MSGELEINFEVNGLRFLQADIRALLMQSSEPSFGYLIFQGFRGPELLVATIDHEQVPYGQRAPWDPPTIICCDDVLVSHQRMYLHYYGFTTKPPYEISFVRHFDHDYMPVQYRWNEPWPIHE